MKKIKFIILILMLGFSSVASATIDTDNFDRADAADIGANWGLTFFNQAGATIGISSNKAQPPATYDYRGWNAHSFGNDQYSQMTFSGSLSINDDAGYIGPITRGQGTTNSASGYYVTLHTGSNNVLYSVTTGTFTVIATLAVPNTGDTVKLRSVGNNQIWSINGVDQSTTVDSAVPTGGAPGILAFKSASDLFIDNWEGGDVPVSSFKPIRFLRTF